MSICLSISNDRELGTAVLLAEIALDKNDEESSELIEAVDHIIQHSMAWSTTLIFRATDSARSLDRSAG